MIDIQTIRQMIREESPARFDVGTVLAADVRGDHTVGVRTSGTGAVTRAMTCVQGLQPGDQVLVVYIVSIDRVVVVAEILNEYEGGLSRHGQLSPPKNLTYTPIPAGVEVRWDTWPGEDLCWQVRYNSSASDTGATDVLITRGSYYLHWTVDASGDMDTAATTYFRVRAVRWIADSNIMFSGWSAWSAAQTSGGHNLREIAELEFEDATTLTLDAAGAITRTQVYHRVDTFGGAATDNLDTINGGTEGDLLIIRPEDGGRTIVVKHDTGNIWFLGGADVTLDELNDHVMLVYSSTGFWCDVGGGGGGGGATTFLGLTDTPAAYAGFADHIPAVDPTESFLQWIACAGWLSISDISDLAWAPDRVAVLHEGRTYEYDDPDDAFTNAVAGDVVLIPPGTWILSTHHVGLSHVSVVGLGGGPEDCLLQSTWQPNAKKALIQLNDSGVAFNFSIDWTIASPAGAKSGLYISAGCQAYFVKATVTTGSGTAAAIGCNLKGDARRCAGHAYSAAGNAYGFHVADGATVQECEGYGETGAVGGVRSAYGVYISEAPENAPVRGCLGIGVAASGNSYGLGFGDSNAHDVYVAGCYFDGGTADVRGDYSAGYFYDVRYESEQLGNGTVIVYMAGDRASVDHHATHEWGGSDEVTIMSLQGRYVSPAAPSAGDALIWIVDAAGCPGASDISEFWGPSECCGGGGSCAGYLKLDGTTPMTGDLDMGTKAITNVGNVDGVDVGDHSARHDVGGADALTTTQGDVASEIVATDANKGIRPARLGVGVAVPGADGDGQLAGNVILSGAAKAVKGTGSVYPTLGTTTEAEKFGHAYLALTKDVYPDGETNANAGLMRRFVNRAGIGSYTHHRGSGTGIPAGCTLTATPASLWAPWLAGYIGWFYGTYYQHYPNHATLPAGLTCSTANPLGVTILTARVHVTGGCCFGAWADNYEVTRNYAVGEYIYRYDVYGYGNGPETLLYTQAATSVCTGGGIGAAATWAAWVNHAVTGPYGPFCPCGDGIVIRLRANHGGTAACYPYVIGEQGAGSGLGAAQTLYDDAWPGTSAYAARRIGMFQRLQGYALSAWDWYYLG